uniref:Uncharacterized protein n=1 Tax=Candidatus Kentrum sp. LFY TaxID=2126342 RepID=A0A450UK84_9GAMM|nr:MAG: hypothetical protein BECKLFY1418A_GA0070994_102715 [Candidatus Kentron sp. LFY]
MVFPPLEGGDSLIYVSEKPESRGNPASKSEPIPFGFWREVLIDDISEHAAFGFMSRVQKGLLLGFEEQTFFHLCVGRLVIQVRLFGCRLFRGCGKSGSRQSPEITGGASG